MADAGWNRDPMGRHELRYWTGSEWSEHVSDNGRTAIDPLQSTGPDDAAPTSARAMTQVAPNAERALGGGAWSGFRRLPAIVQVAAASFGVVLALVALGSVAEPASDVTGDEIAAEVDSEPVTPTTESQATTTTQAPTTTVASTTTAAPTTTVAPTTTAAPTTTSPPPTTTAKPAPQLFVAPPTTAAPSTAAPAASSGCHPSYQGTCIPADVSDADCAGGSGNGPYYVEEENIAVVGPDQYDLDRDGNGVGCES